MRQMAAEHFERDAPDGGADPQDTHGTTSIAERTISRREVLRRGAVVGAGAAAMTLSIGRSRAAFAGEAPVVVVVGAGLAGLTCTYRLNKRGIPATLYEAQDRIGGRCWSIRIFDNAQTAEHGGQYIDFRHRQIRALADELGIELIDTFAQSFPAGSNSYRWLNGKLRNPGRIFADFPIFLDRLKADYDRVGNYFYDQAGPAAIEFDRSTMTEWFDDNLPGGSGSLLGIALGVFMQSFFGLNPQDMSPINLFEAFVVPYKGANERYRVAGGNDNIPHALEHALPRGALRLQTPLVAAWDRSDGKVGLRFEGVAGDVHADQVVFALPFTVLRDVDLSGLTLSRHKRRAIRTLAMGTNSKFNLQLDRTFKALDWDAGFVSDVPHYVTWDSTYGQSNPAPRTPVLTIYNGGTDGASYPTNVAHGVPSLPIVQTALANLERGVAGISDAWNGRAFLDSWVDDPWVHGSYAGFGPGQYTDFWGFLGGPEGVLHFAGEHTSTHSQGYLNGGVESGERAASEVRQALRARTV
jgi:monoamine oxidase